MRTLVIANQKGGVGKTTLTVHLAYSAIAANLRVLLIDMDTGNLGSTFGPTVEDKPTFLKASQLFDPATEGRELEMLYDKVAIIRSDAGVAEVDMSGAARIHNPKLALKRFASQFDLCLIDTPPTLGPRLVGPLIAANYVITPLAIGKYEMDGVQALTKTIRATIQNHNRSLSYAGIQPMKTNLRRKSEMAQLKELERIAGGALLPDHLPERAAVRNAIEAGVPVWDNVRGETHGKAAIEWRTACAAILTKVMK